MEIYSILDDMENVWAQIVVWDNCLATCYYCSDGVVITYSSIDKIINNIPTNYIVVKDSIDTDYQL